MVCHPETTDETTRWVFKWLRMLRMARMLRLSRLSSRLQVSIGLRQTHSMALRFVIARLFVAHRSACFWYVIGNNIGTWVRVLEARHQLLGEPCGHAPTRTRPRSTGRSPRCQRSATATSSRATRRSG